MKVILKHNTPLYNCSDAIRKCHDNMDKQDSIHAYFCSECQFPSNYSDDFICFECGCKSLTGVRELGVKDKALIDNVGNKMKHSSTLEHIVYTFDIDGISRAVLQELARHRIASYTVKSSRYTLKELLKEDKFAWFDYDWKIWNYNFDTAEKYLVFTESKEVNEMSIRALENLRTIIGDGISNDIAKYCMPESYKTSLICTINARSLQNFLTLRSSKEALWEIQELSKKVFEALPDDDKYLFENNMLNLEEIYGTKERT